MERRSIILKRSLRKFSSVVPGFGSLTKFIDLIKSFSFDCKSYPNRIAPFPHYSATPLATVNIASNHPVKRNKIMKHNPKFVCLLLATVVLCFGFSGIATAQEITGSIVGSVKDANGAAVKGATVTVTDTQKKAVVRTATTDDDGAYAARDLHVGTYNLIVEATGFKKHISSKVQVDVGTPRTLNIALEVGSVAEVVTVEANPLAVELATPTVSTVISGDQARELSLNNRDWVQLITLAPGVSNDLADQVYVGTTN